MSVPTHISAMPIRGNASSDMPIFRAIEQFVRDDTQVLEDRADAIRYLGNVVMGIPSEPIDDQGLVDAYLSDAS